MDTKALRKALNLKADELQAEGSYTHADDLRAMIDLAKKRSPVRRMRAKCDPVTPAKRRRVIELADTTSLHGAEIAVMLNLNPGRVTEILQSR